MCISAAIWMLVAVLVPPVQAAGTLVLEVVDQETGEAVPARLILRRGNGTRAPVRRGVDAGVGAAVDGPIELALPPNTYQFEISRGPEYRVLSGSFTLDRDSADSRTVELPRIVDMAAEGWIGGDVMTAVPPRDLGARMAAEALPVAGLISKRDRPPTLPSLGLYTARDDLARGTGAGRGLLVVGIDQAALEIGEHSPSSDLFRAAAKTSTAGKLATDAKLIVTNPLAWDMPIWLSSDRVDAVTVLGEFLQLDREVTQLADSRMPTKFDYGGPQGIGRWAEQIYWQMLEAGFRIPPAAASGAGIVANPVGYNRVYVNLDAAATEGAESLAAAWWDGLWQGRSVVTNGPLLRPTLGGFAPGHRFEASAGESLELTLELKLATADPVEYLEVVRDGRVVYHARLDEFARAGGQIPPFRFEQSGWVLVRVVTKYPSHLRAAISAPWFVTFDGQPRVSTRGVDFFRTWLAEREEQLVKLPPEQRDRHVPYVRAARRFWQARAEAANAP